MAVLCHWFPPFFLTVRIQFPFFGAGPSEIRMGNCQNFQFLANKWFRTSLMGLVRPLLGGSPPNSLLPAAMCCRGIRDGSPNPRQKRNTQCEAKKVTPLERKTRLPWHGSRLRKFAFSAEAPPNHMVQTLLSYPLCS
jgi:hypothetical protein